MTDTKFDLSSEEENKERKNLKQMIVDHKSVKMVFIWTK